MAKKDQATLITVDSSIVSATTIVDTQGYESLTFVLPVINTTSLALTHGDDSGLSDGAAVGSDFLIGQTAYTATGTGKLGYVGKKRYVQITVTNPATDTTIVAVKGNPLKAPTADV